MARQGCPAMQARLTPCSGKENSDRNFARFLQAQLWCMLFFLLETMITHVDAHNTYTHTPINTHTHLILITTFEKLDWYILRLIKST